MESRTFSNNFDRIDSKLTGLYDFVSSGRSARLLNNNLPYVTLPLRYLPLEWKEASSKDRII